MPRWTTKVETGGQSFRVTYGFDKVVAFFVTVISRRGKREYDALTGGYDGLRGFLKVLVDEGVFTEDQVHEALDALPHTSDPNDLEDPGARQVAEMVLNVKSAAAGE